MEAASLGTLLLMGLLAGSGLTAADFPAPVAWGVSAGSRAPLPGDLQVTTGAGLAPCLGLYAAWQVLPDQEVRTVGEAGWFEGATRAQASPSLGQTLSTRVSDAALGAEYFWCPARLGGAWELGAGLYLIRWRVASTNQLTTPGGAFSPSGTSTWTREGLGVLAGRRWNPHLATVAKVQFSHYGTENQPTRLLSLNVLWHF